MKEKLINLVNQEFKGKGIITAMENERNIRVEKKTSNESMIVVLSKRTNQIAVKQTGKYLINALLSEA